MNVNATARIKLHASGSYAAGKSPSGGFGGIFLNGDGEWRLGYHGHLQSTSRLETELWAIYRGLTILHEEGWLNVVIETTCQEAISLLNTEFFKGDAVCREITMQIRILLRGSKCTLNCTPGERNALADALANMGADDTEELVVYLTRPSHI